MNNAPAPGERAIAVGNTVTNIQNPATDNGTNEAGIWLGGRNNVAFRNTIDGTGWEGVWTGGDHSRPIVHSNVIRNTKMAGVYLEHSSDDARIENNSITQTEHGRERRVDVRRRRYPARRGPQQPDRRRPARRVPATQARTTRSSSGNSILDSSGAAHPAAGRAPARLCVDNDLQRPQALAVQAYCVRENDRRQRRRQHPRRLLDDHE